MCRVCRARGLRKGGGGLPYAVVGGKRSALASGPCQVAVEWAGGQRGRDGGGGGEGPPSAGADNALATGVRFAGDEDEDVVDAGRSGPIHRVVVGAGVAGTCCAEELCRLRPDDRVTLLTAADVVKVCACALFFFFFFLAFSFFFPLYFNFKGFQSIVLMSLMDSEYEFFLCWS